MISNILHCLHQLSSSLQRVLLIMIKFSSIFAVRHKLRALAAHKSFDQSMPKFQATYNLHFAR